MATVYLHGGMPKTGTTAIQHFLSDNRNALEKQGAIYPDFSDLFDWIANRRNAHWLLGIKPNAEKIEKMDKAVRRITELSQKYHTIILSDEQLWYNRIWDPSFWEFFTDLLKPCNVQIKLVIYVRRQDLYLYSNWAQSIKSTVDVPFKSYTFAQYIEEGYHEKQHLNYRDVFAAVEPFIGRENIILRVFESGQLKDESITADFLQTVGLTADAEYSEPEKIINVSLKDSVLETKRYLNRLPGFVRDNHVKGNPFLNRLLQVQSELEEEGLLRDRTGFTNEARRELMLLYEDSNAETARRYLNREDGILFYEQIPETKDDSQEFTTEELIEVCGRLILNLRDKIEGQEETIGNLRSQNAKLSKEINDLKKENETYKSKRRFFGRR